MTKDIISYDIRAIPDIIEAGKPLVMVDYMDIMETTGFLYYDGSKGNKPERLKGDKALFYVDASTPEGRAKLIEAAETLKKRQKI